MRKEETPVACIAAHGGGYEGDSVVVADEHFQTFSLMYFFFFCM